MSGNSYRRREQENLESEENIYAALEPSVNELIHSLSRLNRTSTEFLKIDVETALTFCSIARQTEDLTKRQRNCRNARKGYDTIHRLMGRVRLTDDDEQFLSEKMTRLKFELLRLGEKF
jgi:hypothetical protein